MVWTMRVIKEVIGVSPTMMRPAFGDIDPRVRAIMHALKLQVVLWNRDTKDWNYQTYTTAPRQALAATKVSQSFQAWLAQPKMGTISLQHDYFTVTTGFIPMTLQLLEKSGVFC
jgi:peptidoglycan/xylan/chitin deacetylase (PgdA/CDA1 family)